MFVLAIVLTAALLLETLPSAVAGLSELRAGMTRLDQLTRLGLTQGRNLWVVPLVGVAHLAGSAAVIAGVWMPAVGAGGAGLEVTVFAWVLSRQLRAGDRGRALLAYSMFASVALSVLIVDAVR
jgi:hypothetical protein